MKIISKRNIYLLSVFVVTLLVIVMDKTYAKFPSSYTTNDNIVGLVLDFNIGITNIEEYQEIDVEAGKIEKFNIKVTNNLGSDTSYGVWYRMVEPDAINSNIEIGRLKGSSTTTSGTIKNNNDLTVTIVIKNNTTSSIKIDVGVATSKQGSTDIEYINGKKLITGEVSYKNTFIDILKKDAQLDTNIDFSKISSDTNGKGVYIRSGTENDINPIYYYRGEVYDNNVIFADMCFKIVRTTETGGIKLIYNGLPTDGQCNAIGADATIGRSAFNNINNSPAYGGYMYGSVYEPKTTEILNDSYIYGHDVTYSNETYTLTDVQTGYTSGLDNYHYTCGSSNKTCDTIKYIYYYGIVYEDGDWVMEAQYIEIQNGKKVEDALNEMLNDNTHSSTIKGNKDTVGTIDNWYYTNIEQKGHSNYLEDTIWCNDRRIDNYGGWTSSNPLDDHFSFIGTYKVYGDLEDMDLSFSCARKVDSFTVNDKKGNGALDYPVGLLTADEVRFAGSVGYNDTRNDKYYLYIGDDEDWWTMSNDNFAESEGGGVYMVIADNGLHMFQAFYEFAIRPSISLKPGTLISGGIGTKEEPYII